MKYILIIPFFFLTLQSFSQKREIDSLNVVLNQIDNDSLKVLEFDKILNKYRNTKPKIHLYFIKKRLSKIKNTNNKKQYASLTKELGIYFKKKGELDSAILYYKNALKMYQLAKDIKGQYNIKASMANIYKAKGNFPKAIKYFNEVIVFFENQGDKGKQAVLISKSNLALVYLITKDYKKADSLLEEVFNTPLTKSNKKFYSSICINLMASKTKLNLLDEALKFGHLSEKIETRPKSLANLYVNLGNIYQKQKKYELAGNYYKKGLLNYQELENYPGIINSYNNIGNNFTLWTKYDQAENYLLKSYDLLKRNNNIKSLKHNYEMLTSLYKDKGSFKKAYYYQQKLYELNDSILGVEKQKAIADFEVKYDTEKTKREKQKAIQETKIAKLKSQKNRNLFLGLLGFSLLLILTSIFYYGKLRAKKHAQITLIELKETQKRLAIEKQYRDSELKALKAQMNPHFIFNALNSIQDYIVLNQKNLASDYLGKFADLIRNYLHFSNTGFISVKEEVHNLNLYLELEKLRFEEKLKYVFNIEDGINSDLINIPTMLIQPYVENALKHGLLHKKDNRNLSISLTKSTNKTIECIIEDNGIGRIKAKELNDKKLKQHKSFALKANTERLDLLNFGKERKIGVEIIDLIENEEAKGTRVILKIPILKKN